jgi:hypothetical protein
MLFTFGYGYVATLVASEEMARRASVSAAPAAADSVPPPAPSETDIAEAA